MFCNILFITYCESIGVRRSSAWRLLTASTSLFSLIRHCTNCCRAMLLSFSNHTPVILNHSAHFSPVAFVDRHIYVTIGLNFWIRQRHIQDYHIFDNHKRICWKKSKRPQEKNKARRVPSDWNLRILNKSINMFSGPPNSDIG